MDGSQFMQYMRSGDMCLRTIQRILSRNGVLCTDLGYCMVIISGRCGAQRLMALHKSCHVRTSVLAKYSRADASAQREWVVFVTISSISLLSPPLIASLLELYMAAR